MKSFLLLLTLCLGLAAPAGAGEGGDLIVLKTGTLADFDRATDLIYDQITALPAAPELAEREVGQVVLAADPADDSAVTLSFQRGEATRRMGSFPQSVGNPLFMYAAEAVIRDMAHFAGGSPFYIRNRLKDALANRASFTEGTAQWNGAETDTLTAVMRPFEGDPNRARMQGFADLTLTVVMSDAVPGWYLSFDAEALSDGALVYRRKLELQP